MNSVTQQIVDLLAKRIDLARKVGELKRGSGSPVLDLAREEELISTLVSSSGIQDKESLRRILREIVSLCRNVQETTTVAVPMTMMSYSEEAALSVLGSACRFVASSGVEQAFEAVATGFASFCVTPYESTSQGAYAAALDLLVEKDLKIVGEVVLGVRYFLVSRESRLEDLRTVVADPEAVSACRTFLSNVLRGCRIVYSQRADSGGFALPPKRRGYATLAPRGALRDAKLNVLAEDVQDDKDGATRFIVVGKEGGFSSNLLSEAVRYKTSVVFTADNKPGFLSRALGCFSSRGINLTMIVSRPLKSRRWEYVFVADFDCRETDQAFAEAQKELRGFATMCRVLGTYPEITPAAGKSTIGK